MIRFANIARKVNVNPEEALQSTNRKFMTRFQWMESHAENFEALTLEEMDALWNEAKQVPSPRERGEG